MRTRLLSLCAVLLLALPGLAAAADLDTAKAQGLVGETPEGYLAAVAANPSAEVRALVDDINGKRRAQYLRIANQNGIALDDVETLAGAKAIEKTASGHLVRVPGEGWVRKP